MYNVYMKTTKKQAPKPAIITIKTDPETKQAFQQYAALLDVPLSTMLIGSAWQAVRKGSITLEPVLEPTPYLQKLIKKADADYKAGKNIVGPFTTDESLQKYLGSL